MHNLDHVNILKFINWYETGNHIWLILEYCSGGDLRKLIAQDARLPEASVRAFTADVRAGLQFRAVSSDGYPSIARDWLATIPFSGGLDVAERSYLHSRGIVYCDLCPATLLFTGTGTVKLCDFKMSTRLCDVKQVGPPDVFSEQLLKILEYTLNSKSQKLLCLQECTSACPVFGGLDVDFTALFPLGTPLSLSPPLPASPFQPPSLRSLSCGCARARRSPMRHLNYYSPSPWEVRPT